MDKNKGFGVSANTVHHYHACIHRALKDAMMLQYIDSNPSDKVILPKKVKHQANYYSPDQLKFLIDVVADTKLEIPVFVAGWFGLRLGEICGLRWKDIDLDNDELYVKGVITSKGNGTPTDNLEYRAETKTKASIRVLAIPSKAHEFFEDKKKEQEQNKDLCGNSYNYSWKEFICVDNMGNLLQPEYISKAFAKFIKKYELPKITFHELRHSNLSLLVNCGIDMKKIQLWGGHSNYSTTADIYSHMRSNYRKELGETINNALT